MSTYSTFAATGGADGPAGGGGGLVCGTTSYTVCADSNRTLAICLTCECPTGSICLPNATALSPGSPTFIVKNENTNTTFLLRDNAACVLTSILPGQAVDASLYNNSSSDGEWVIGKFSTPTAFNPGSKIEIFEGGKLDDVNVFSQDCNGGIIAATWSRPQCCYKVTVFKCINGEYARTGQVSGNFPRCDFGACFLKNGFIFYTCRNCACGSALVDYAKCAVLVNCDATCAVGFLDCCAVGLCHNGGNDNSGCWIEASCGFSNGFFYSTGLMNYLSRCGYINIVKFETTTTGAPTCTQCLLCCQSLPNCGNWCYTKIASYNETSSNNFVRPRCCEGGVTQIWWGTENCACGDSYIIVNLKGGMCAYYIPKGCINTNCTSANSVYGNTFFMCDQPMICVCLSGAFERDMTKLCHCGSPCCNCRFEQLQSTCGFIPLSQNFIFKGGCCWCVADSCMIRIGCFCANCLCYHSLQRGTESLCCFNYSPMSGYRCASLCLFGGAGSITASNHAWNEFNSNDGTRRCTAHVNCYSGQSTTCNPHFCVIQGGYSVFIKPNNWGNTFYLTCDTATCLAGYILDRGQNHCHLKLKQFHLNTSHQCRQCEYCILIPAEFHTEDWCSQCLFDEHKGLKYWDATNSRVCFYNLARGLSTMWCLCPANKAVTACCLCGNGANHQVDLCCMAYQLKSHNDTKFIGFIRTNCCTNCPSFVTAVDVTTFPGCVHCCSLDSTRMPRHWVEAYSADRCAFLAVGKQYICGSSIFTDTGLIYAKYNPTTKCFDSVSNGAADGVQETFSYAIPNADAITAWGSVNLNTYIKGKD